MLWTGKFGFALKRALYSVWAADFARSPWHQKAADTDRAFATDEPQPHFLSQPVSFPAEEFR
jgi:hypothetical protein